MAEAGYPEVNIKLWSGYFAAAGTPPAIVAKIEAGLRKAIRDPDVQRQAQGAGGHAGRQFVGRFPRDDRHRHRRAMPP